VKEKKRTELIQLVNILHYTFTSVKEVKFATLIGRLEATDKVLLSTHHKELSRAVPTWFKLYTGKETSFVLKK